MKITETSPIRVLAGYLAGVILYEPETHTDKRGTFMEMWRGDAKPGSAGANGYPVQWNLTESHRNVIRGLHMQTGQVKVVRCVSGSIFDVIVDPESKRWLGVNLPSRDCRQIHVPDGYLHGFCVTSKTATVLYGCSKTYCPDDEITVAWNDPDIGIDWPIDNPILSERDANAGFLRDL